ncbi:unnamed protein product [Effrenium voratum]|uniref:DDE-1 domain-containing protein n=1 Tax=Effrenium voratum TaxID=2562239 RepID=A0AA36IBL8_9DINO|nr:unnamed protein product [Effrenium voratum]
MDQPDFDAAAARLAVQTLQAQLTANRNAAKALYRQQSRRHERAGRGGLGPAGQKTTLAVYLLSGHNIELATVMAQRLSSFKHAQTPGYPSAATVESLFLAAPMSEICQAHASETPAWVTATQQAQAFLAENSTVQWVETMNVGHGVTPSSVDVFLQCEGALLGHQPDLGAPSKRTVNKWAARWRLRWGVRRKTLQPEGYIEPEELRTKVRAFWHTLAHVSAKYSHKQIVFLNLDETSVGFNMTPLAGCVAAACVQRGLRLRAKVKKENLRGAMSYVALICDSAELQGKLPHYLIGSTVRLTKTIMKGIAALPATQLRILRRKSAWNTSEVMVAIIKDVSKTLQPVLDAGNVQPVLLLDCAPAHLPLPVMQAASDCGIQLLFIPSSCTHIAQPLDIRAFAGFKMYLKKVHRELRAASAEGLISPLAWIWHLTQAPRQFFAAKKWKPSFEAVGAGGPTDLHVCTKT